ncbi:19627_t:CDS:10 [Funneliformis geosporum]|uniref:Mitochondrial escape protein 2 n=1 Tax=Funneliformis geosporum TaxID=1117311 RepID=A0A9W4WXR1_9GLOM|nr:13923_t:CDS:10 [Funneliformis geosporum]CAI2180527.1 19627_t:CDS:10 [Funneliformis geosporum]
MFRILQNQTRSSKIILSHKCTHLPLNLSRSMKRAAETVSIEQVEHGRFYYDNIYPLKIGSFDIRHFLVRSNKERLEKKLKTGKWIPAEDEMPYKFKVEGVEPRKKEGGMLVKFTFRVEPEKKKKALEEISQLVEDFLKDKKIIPWFNVRPTKAYLGEPFIEDLAYRYPASRLRVEFQGNDVSIETLYKYLRPYGLIRDITLLPPSSKDLPRYVMVLYSKMRSATSAKNCVHGLFVKDTRLNIIYDMPLKTNQIYNWMAAHPRISVPFIAASIAFITYTIFDPIRVFFISSKVTQRFNIREYRLYQWLRKETIDRVRALRETSEDEDESFADLSAWKEREQEESKLQNWLKEPPETFIVLLGPTGSGKSSLINKVIQKKRNKVFIKCDVILNSRDENELVLKLAKQVGYFPVFTLLVTLSNLIDGLASATIGQKTVGFSSTTDTEIKKILDALAISLHDIAPESLTKRSWYNQKKSHDYLEAPIVDSYDPAEIPIIVIDAYMTKDKESHELWDHLAKLAALLVENKVAHVVFVSSNIGIVKHLSRALPNKSFNYAVLSDAPHERAISLVKRHVHDKNLEGLEEAVGVLGGRLTDLRLFINKIRSGQKPIDALQDLVAKAIIDVRKLAFGDDNEDATTIPWSGIQFWEIMKKLSKGESVSYDSVKFSPIFGGDDTQIRAMEQAELISITQINNNGRPNIIKPGKPLYQAAFAEISRDELFAATMELQTVQHLLSLENNKIKKFEDELEKLGSLFVKIDGKWLLGNGHVPETVEHRNLKK